MGSPEGKSIISNPVTVHDANNQTMVFCLCDDGQVYYQQQDAGRLVDFGKWLAIASKIPYEAGKTRVCTLFQKQISRTFSGLRLIFPGL